GSAAGNPHGVCIFFSSRRRHPRFSRDWSSDVCSSDLPEADFDLTKECVEAYRDAYNEDPEFYAANYYEIVRMIVPELIKRAVAKIGRAASSDSASGARPAVSCQTSTGEEPSRGPGARD